MEKVLELLKELDNRDLAILSGVVENLIAAEAMVRTEGNQVHAAKLLRINRNTLRKRIGRVKSSEDTVKA